MFCEFCPANGEHCSVCECEMREMARLRQLRQDRSRQPIPTRRDVSPTPGQTFASRVLLACAGALVGITAFKLLAG